MKKYSIYFSSVLLCILLTAALLCVGCTEAEPSLSDNNSEANEGTGTGLPETEEITEPVTETGTEETTAQSEDGMGAETDEVQDEPVMPDDEGERLRFCSWMYEEATNLIFYFDVCSMPGLGDAIDNEGYVRVDTSYTGIDSYEDLTARLKNVFSDAKTEQLLARNVYVERDGALCGLDFARGTDICVGEDVGYEVLDNGDGSYSFVVTYEYLDEEDMTPAGTKQTEYRIISENGRWCFEDFELFR